MTDAPLPRPEIRPEDDFLSEAAAWADSLAKVAADLGQRVEDYYLIADEPPREIIVTTILQDFAKLLTISVDDDNGPPYIADIIELPALFAQMEECTDVITDKQTLTAGLQELAVMTESRVREAIDYLARQGAPEARKSMSILTSMSAYLASVSLQASAEKARVSASEAESSASVAEAAAEEAQETSGEVAEHVLARFYSKTASAESRAANWFRAATIAVLTGAVAAGAYFDTQSNYYSAAEALARLSLLLPLAALVGYLASVAHEHRLKSDRSAEIAVQLQTIVAFASRLDMEDRREIQVQLGKAIFTGAAERTRGRRSQKASISSDAVSTIADAAALANRATK